MAHIQITEINEEGITLQLSTTGAEWIAQALRNDNGEQSLLLRDVAVALQQTAAMLDSQTGLAR